MHLHETSYTIKGSFHHILTCHISLITKSAYQASVGNILQINHSILKLMSQNIVKTKQQILLQMFSSNANAKEQIGPKTSWKKFINLSGTIWNIFKYHSKITRLIANQTTESFWWKKLSILSLSQMCFVLLHDCI